MDAPAATALNNPLEGTTGHVDTSWLNLIERWFREITDKRIRRGVFHSVPDLIKAIMDYIQHHNKNPKTLIWTAKVDAILQKISRAKKTLDKYISE